MIKVEDFLNDIKGDINVGPNMFQSKEFEKIRYEKMHEEDNMSKGIWERDYKVANWQNVYDISSEMLKNKTKDLQLCIWICESLIFTRGLEGLLDGILITHGIIEKYWQQMYPQDEYKAALMSWFETSLQNVLLNIVVIPSNIQGESFMMHHWIAFAYKRNQKGEETESAGGLSDEVIKERVRSIEEYFFKNKIDLIAKIKDAVENFQELVLQKSPEIDFQMARSVVFIDRINAVFEELLDIQNKQINILNQRKDQIANDKQSKEKTEDIQSMQSDKTEQEDIMEEESIAKVEIYDDDIKDVFIEVQNAYDWLCKNDKNNPSIMFLSIALKLKDMGTHDLLKFLSDAKIDLASLMNACGSDNQES